MKLKKLFLLSTMLLSFSCSTAYCATTDNTSVPLTSDTNYSVELSTTNDETLYAITHMYFDMKQGNEIRVGNRILFPVTVVKNNIVDFDVFYAPKYDVNNSDLLVIEFDNNTFTLKSYKDKNDYFAIIEALDNQLQTILANNPDIKCFDM